MALLYCIMWMFYALFMCMCCLIFKNVTLSHSVSMNMLMSCVQMHKCKGVSCVCVCVGEWTWVMMECEVGSQVSFSSCRCPVVSTILSPILWVSPLYQVPFMTSRYCHSVLFHTFICFLGHWYNIKSSKPWTMPSPSIYWGHLYCLLVQLCKFPLRGTTRFVPVALWRCQKHSSAASCWLASVLLAKLQTHIFGFLFSCRSWPSNSIPSF